MFRALWTITLSAAGILMVTMGVRQSLGLIVSPLNTSTGLGIASISLAMAVGQFTWGAIQPVAGALADRYSWMWYADIALALGAALVNLPIREAAVFKPAAP